MFYFDNCWNMLLQGLILYSNRYKLVFNETSKTSPILSSYSNCSPYRLNIGRSIGFFITMRSRKREEAINSLRKHTDDLILELEKWIKGPLFFIYVSPEVHVRQHIETGYSELWNLLGGKDGIKMVDSQYNALRVDTYKKIEKEIRNQLSQVEIENLSWFVEDIIEFLEKNRLYTFVVATSIVGSYSINSVRSDGSIYRSNYLKGNNEDDLKKLAEILNNLLTDVQIQGMTKSLHNKGEQLYTMREMFVNKMNLIVENITHGVSDKDKILLGKCDRCRNTKEKQKID